MCFLALCLNGLILFSLLSPFHYMEHRICGSYLYIPVQTLHSLMEQPVKNLPAVQETQKMQVQSLGLEDPPEEEIASYSSILAWRIPWTEERGGLQTVHRVAKSRTRLSD